MEDDPRGLILAWARHARDVVAIHRGYVRLTGDIGAGAALSQILYWFDDDKTGTPRARIERDGSLWIAKTYDDFAEELGLIDGEGNPRGKIARRYVQNLQADGLIEVRVFRFNGAPTVHIRPLWNAIFERAAMALPRKSRLGISEAGKSQTGTLENPTAGKSSKEAETTTETTKGLGASNDDAPDAGNPSPPETLVAAVPTDPNGTATRADPNGTEKPKSRKSSAPRIPLGPGSLVYKDVIRYTPNHAQRELLDAAHAAHGEAAMRAVMVAWLAHGYSPKNVAGMVEAINAGGLRPNGHNGNGRANGKPLSAMVLEI